jgi:hypothetical protein
MYYKTFLCILISTLVLAENKGQSTSSPYSLFAMGQIENMGTGTNHAMGGCGIAFRSKYSLNALNPASYTGLDSMSFLVEAGIIGKYTRYKSSSETQTRYDANLRYLAMGCRITPWWQTSIGFMPYSSVGYTINTIDYVQGELSAYYKIYGGSGGVNQFYWGHSIRLFKDLGLGINISYYLGSIDHTETATTADGDISYLITKSSAVHQVLLDYGAQYTFRHKDIELTLGAIYSDRKVLSTTNEVTIEYADDIINLDESNDDYTIPRKYGFGIAFQKAYNFRAGFDYERKEWGKINVFKNPLLITRDGERFSAGVEFTPYTGLRDEGWKRMSFRLGGSYNKSYLIIDQIPLNSYSLVMGVGIPLRKELTMVNLSFEAGQMGTTSNGLFRENYLLMHVNFTLHDKWFMKYGID